MSSRWYVSSYLPDYPVEVTEWEWSSGHSHILFGEDFMYVAGPHEIFDDKRLALEAALRGIRARIRSMHTEGMEDREYDRSREWADALVDGIRLELEGGQEFDREETKSYLREIRREKGEW
jgi:hypothetical protein